MNDDEIYQTTAINIRRDQWVLLGDVANARRKSRGGRQSVSDIIRDLIDANQRALAAELERRTELRISISLENE